MNAKLFSLEKAEEADVKIAEGKFSVLLHLKLVALVHYFNLSMFCNFESGL